MNAVDIILETALNYSSDVTRRAINPNYNPSSIYNGPRCEYLTSDGKMCAIGRCIAEPKLGYAGTAGSFRFHDEFIELDSVLKPEYRGYSKDFWRILQGFHDDDSNWNDHGLSVAGIAALNHLLILFKEEVKSEQVN